MRPFPNQGVRAALTFVVAASTPAVLHAQHATVLGIVVDSTSSSGGEPLVGADVQLTHTDSSGVALDAVMHRLWQRVDSSGTFAFRDLEPGVYRVDVRAIGYAPFQGFMVLARGQELHPRVSLLKLVPRLAPVVTTASASYRARLLEVSGFRDRRRVGFGHFIDSREIGRLQPPSVYSLLRPYLRGCTMMYVNGARAAVPQGLMVSELVGVEIYRRNLEAPPQFQNPYGDCGSIALWTAIPVDDPEVR